MQAESCYLPNQLGGSWLISMVFGSGLEGSLPLPFSLQIWYYHKMPKSTRVVPKKRGRPFTGGRDPVTAIRLSAEMRAAIDAWAAQQADQPPRSEAIRRMIEQVLGASKKKR
jgi:hypothetical protein